MSRALASESKSDDASWWLSPKPVDALGSRLQRGSSAVIALGEGRSAEIAFAEGIGPSGSRFSAEKPSPSANPSEITLCKRFLGRRTLAKRESV